MHLSLPARCVYQPGKINHRLTNLDHIPTPAGEDVDVMKYAILI